MAGLAAARSRAAKGQASSLLFLDLDGIKPVNDVAGHEAEDHLLVQVAERLRLTVRDGDLVGRLGGDEFAVLVADGLEDGTALAERTSPTCAPFSRPAGATPALLGVAPPENGHRSPLDGTGWLTSPSAEAHSVQVPSASLLHHDCSRSLVVA
jgi:GGDEF domain-containing protein